MANPDTISAEEFMKGTEVPTSSAPTETTKVAKPFKDEDFPGYLALVRSKRTTGEVLNNWLEQKGYGRSSNADQIISFARSNPNAVIENKYIKQEEGRDSVVPSAVGPERSVTDSLGMGARGLLTGAGSLVDVAAGPLNMLVNALPGEQGLSTTPFRDAGKDLSDWLGFAVPETDREKLINAINEGGFQGLLTFGAGSALGTGNTAAGAVGKALTASPVSDVIGGAAGLGASEQTRQMGGGPVAQLAAALATGGVSTITSLRVAKSLASNPRSVPETLLRANEIDPASLPAGVTPEAAAANLPALNALQDEAAAFKGAPEPKPTDLFPTEASRAAKAEAWGESLGAPTQKPATDTGVSDVPPEPVTPVQAPEPTISKKEADKLFQEAAAPVKAQTTKEWEKSLQASADEFQSGRGIADNGEPLVPSVRDSEVSVPLRTDRGMPTPEAPTGEVVTRLTDAINNASKIGAKVQRRLYSQERSRRLGLAAQARRAGPGGEAGLRAEMAQLKGELPKADFEAVRPQFTQEEIDGLFNHIVEHPKLSMYDQINARTGLGKLLDGQVPTRSEISLLDKAFPKEFVQAALKNRSTMSKTLDFAGNALNLPRSLMSTFDLSAPLRQGVFLVGRKEFYKGFANMFKMFGSEKAYQATMDSIKSHPNYPWMEEAKLGLTEMGGSLSKREEAFMSDWAERIPIIGKGVKASDRAYSGFLNKLRADTFSTILEQGKAAGINLVDDPKFVKDIAKFVNNATGRGSLGPLSQAGPVLNGLFFSPRLMASRVAMLNPATYATLSPIVRKEAVKSLLAFGTLATTVMGLAAANGLEVESDPRSSDFAKVKNGNTRYDILGGFGQYITLGARLATNETKTMKGAVKTMGQSYGSPTRLDAVVKFLTNKESPVASFVTDYLRGQNAIGEPFEVRKAIVSRMLPLLAQDVAEAYQERGAASAAAMAPGLFGVGVQNFNTDTKSKTEFNKGEVIPNTGDPNPAPEPEVIKDTLSAEDFMKGTEVK